MRMRRFAPAMTALVLAWAVAVPVASAQAPQATTLEKVSSVVQPGILYLETTYTGIVAGTKVSAGSTCTGFFVNPDGHFATAGHCVDRRVNGREAIITKWLTDGLGGEPPPDLLQRAIANVRIRSAETPARSGPDRAVKASYGVNYGGLPTGRPLPARVLGLRAFDRGDVALGKIEAENAPTLELAPADTINVGSSVVSVGYPGKVDVVTDQTFAPSFKDGAISSKKTRGGGVRTVYEVSAAVAGGMSGGPTVDLEGRVVGVNSFGADAATEQFNFISPVTEIENLLADEGVENELGPIDTAYREGLTAYYAGDREAALAKFDEVLGQVPENEFAQRFRAQTLRLAEPAQEDEGGGFPWLLVALIALALAAVAAAVLLLRRRGAGLPALRGGSRGGPSLVGTTGPLAGERFPVSKEVVIGRAGAGIAIDDAEVSRRHASVRRVEGGLLLSDLGSANGTEVNGTPIDRPTVVVDGDVISVGTASFAVDMPELRASSATRLHGAGAAAPSAAPSPPVLLVDKGPLAGRRFAVERELLVGRDGADITVHDPEVSRRHARLRPVDGGVEVADLDSANGTAVNGALIHGPTRVTAGDVITFGQTSMSLTNGNGARTVAKATTDAGA